MPTLPSPLSTPPSTLCGKGNAAAILQLGRGSKMKRAQRHRAIIHLKAAPKKPGENLEGIGAVRGAWRKLGVMINELCNCILQILISFLAALTDDLCLMQSIFLISRAAVLPLLPLKSLWQREKRVSCCRYVLPVPLAKPLIKTKWQMLKNSCCCRCCCCNLH